jgi:hypothetical protein
MKQRKSDITWKVVLEEIFSDLLRFIFPDADEVYDLERGFEFPDKEMAELHPQPDEEKDSRFADKLVKVFHRDGAEEWVLLHVEVQGDTSERDGFAERMYTYFYRIRDRYQRPVSAVAIFTGKDGRMMPGYYSYEYRGTRLTYEYRKLSILDYTDDELDKSSNPFAQVIIAARMRWKEGTMAEEDLLKIKVLAARKLLEKGFDMPTIRALYDFLRNYVLFDKPEMNRIFDEEVNLTEKLDLMTIDEYEKMIAYDEAKEQLQELYVKKLLMETDFSDEKIASLVDVDIDFVNDVKRWHKDTIK